FAPSPSLPKGWVDRLTACDNLRNVSGLSLGYTVSAEEVGRLLASWNERHLRELIVRGIGKGNLAAALVACSAIASVRCLDLWGNRLTASAVAQFVRGSRVDRLIALDIGRNSFGNTGLAELLNWPQLSKLRSLSLGWTRLSNAGADELARSPA